MRLDFECSGGFANLELRYTVDTKDLPPDTAGEIERLVEESGLFNDTSKHSIDFPPRSTPARDTISYRLTLDSETGNRFIEVDDSTATPELLSLLSLLRGLALHSHAGRAGLND